MGFGHDYSLAASKLRRWGLIPSGLEEKVVTLEELQKLFPETEHSYQAEIGKTIGGNGGIMLSEEPGKRLGLEMGYTEYVQPMKSRPRNRNTFKIAYECKACEKIIIGPPTIESKTDEDYTEKCTNCKSTMHTHNAYS